MTSFRCESVLDRATGLYYVQVYYPDTATTPLVTGNPIYPSLEAAEADAVKIFTESFKDQPIKAVRK
jgi:hypothetical protein